MVKNRGEKPAFLPDRAKAVFLIWRKCRSYDVKNVQDFAKMDIRRGRSPHFIGKNIRPILDIATEIDVTGRKSCRIATAEPKLRT
jgi:hypothetical protein